MLDNSKAEAGIVYHDCQDDANELIERHLEELNNEKTNSITGSATNGNATGARTTHQGIRHPPTLSRNSSSAQLSRLSKKL